MASLQVGVGVRAASSEDGSEGDDMFAGPGGKKRKVPGAQLHVRDRSNMDTQEEDDVDTINDTTITTTPTTFPLAVRSPRSLARNLCEFRKSLFLRRKAAFIALYIDAQTAINTSPLRSKSTLPDVSSFEKLLPSLEDIGVNAWMPDRPGWKEGRAQSWRTRRCRRRRGVMRKPVERKGLAPEGSFEFEMECQASMRARAREQGALLKLAHELRGVVLSMNKPASVVQTTTTTTTTTNSSDDKPPSKTKRKLDKKVEPAQAPLMTPEPSKDGSEGKTKNKSKKKKRSVLANQSNPHHVNNYRPSRTVSPHGDPYEPYPHHLDLVAPPSMHFLAAQPIRKTAPIPGTHAPPTAVRPAEDDYICCFCEFDLYYGSEKARKRAVRQRRRELKRKEAIKMKAKNVAEGRGTLKEESDEEEDDQCSCGRPVIHPEPEQTDAG
ncbi:hypothetical protein CI109_103583 [Kwoniella shandongensis]|uniref:Uncharacterized protein n=1 Tax=Kwoniella shandongensis TaxID=1734106 RepID=A0AAJ8LKV7_9TREE